MTSIAASGDKLLVKGKTVEPTWCRKESGSVSGLLRWWVCDKNDKTEKGVVSEWDIFCEEKRRNRGGT